MRPPPLLRRVQAAATAFYAADVNSDQKLDFEEFKAVASGFERAGDATLREMFEMADRNGSGGITRDEWFFWVMSWLQLFGDDSRTQLTHFGKFDQTGDGLLNLSEFTRAVEQFGFGSLGHQIFAELDVDGSGRISYVELIESLRSQRGTYSLECQRLLTDLSFDLLDGKTAPLGQTQQLHMVYAC